MRAGTGWWAAVAFAGVVVASAACGNGTTAVQGASSVDPHQGPDEACGRCTVTGGGQVMVGEQIVQFSVEAIPDSGPGFGGQDSAAHGQVEVQTVPASGTGPVVGSVDTLVSCDRTGGVLTAVVSGSVAGQRFTATVTDRGDPAVDDGVVAVGGMTFGPVSVVHGDVQVQALDACHAQCGEGQCWCYDNDRCEPCSQADTTPPPPVSNPTPPPPPPPPPPIQP